MHSKFEISNTPLRRNNLASFLQRLGITAEVEFLGHNYCFKKESQKEAEELSGQLVSALALAKTESLFFVEELIVEAVNSAPCEPLHKLCCTPLFSLDFDYTLDNETGMVKIKLPNVAYGPMLALLQSPYLKIEAGYLHFDLQQFLENRVDSCFVLTDKKNKTIQVLLKSAPLMQRKVFYVSSELDENHLEVTPYFCVPVAATPPNYHFVLDTSSSMKDNLAKLRESALKFAGLLFDSQPDAILNLKIFATDITNYGQYRISDLPRLESTLNSLHASGSTCLKMATRQSIQKFLQSNKHNNVLLFTDGEDNIDTTGDEERLLDSYISEDKKQSSFAYRNKFFIVSFGVQQGDLMQRIANFFESPIIETCSVDFYQALADEKLLGHWAAARELFTARIEVLEDAQDDTAEHYSESLSCDLSGQFIPLKSKRLSYNGTLKIEILDGEGNPIVQSQETFAKPRLGDAIAGSSSAPRSRSSSFGKSYKSLGLLGFEPGKAATSSDNPGFQCQ